MVDTGQARAEWIPKSHNIPVFADGISGRDVLARQRKRAERYGATVLTGTVISLTKRGDALVAKVELGGRREIREVLARRVSLATGAIDVEPELPDLPDVVRRGLFRYCAICDGCEARAGKLR